MDRSYAVVPLGMSTGVPLRTLARVASVAAGLQFGWALQLSLLTPYVQVLGIPHTWASYIWLCGPISGMFVQPVVGYYSDRCESSWGRRRPFIVVGSGCVALAVLLIAFSADLGYWFGDSLTSRPRAVVAFVLGFWLLDLANNMVQGPSRALLADLSGKSQRRTRSANAFFSLFMAVGNVLGFAAGSYSKWYKVLPFTGTKACGVICANLKSAFLIAIILLITATFLSVTATPEKRWSHAEAEAEAKAKARTKAAEVKGYEPDDENDHEVPEKAFIWELFSALRHLPRPMSYLLLVTALTWVAWFPFLLFDTDWMGREVYRGTPSGSEHSSSLYDEGVRAGSFGLMLNAIVLGATSLVIEFLAQRLGPKLLWALSNLILSILLACTVLITKLAENHPPSYRISAVKISALVVFAGLGAPLAVTYSIPFALTATFTSNSGAGQGLSMGVLNLSIVIPQIIVSIGSGPWDAQFGGGNLPAFVLASVSALASSIAALTLLPLPPPEYRPSGILRTSSCPLP